MHFRMQVIFIFIGIIIYCILNIHRILNCDFSLVRLSCAPEKSSAMIILEFDCSMEREFAGINSIENADVILRMPSVRAELADEYFPVCSCLFQFRCFCKNKYGFLWFVL